MAPRSPIDRRTLALRFREASRHDEAAFAQYGVNAVRRARILTTSPSGLPNWTHRHPRAVSGARPRPHRHASDAFASSLAVWPGGAVAEVVPQVVPALPEGGRGALPCRRRRF